MKRSIFIAVLGMASAVASYGQGYVQFNNYVSSTQSSGITYASGPAAGEGVGPEISVQLYYGAASDTLLSQLVPLTFGDGSDFSPVAAGNGGVSGPGTIFNAGGDAGYGIFNGGAVQIPLTGPNSFAAGSTLAFALVATGTYQTVSYYGASGVFNGTTSSAANVPPLPAGLQAGSFTVAPVPEPTTLALAGLGGAALLALRRKKA
jgi:hypothetical protein